MHVMNHPHEIHAGFESRRHQKSKANVLEFPQNRVCVLQILKIYHLSTFSGGSIRIVLTPNDILTVMAGESTDTGTRRVFFIIQGTSSTILTGIGQTLVCNSFCEHSLAH